MPAMTVAVDRLESLDRRCGEGEGFARPDRMGDMGCAQGDDSPEMTGSWWA